MHIVFTEHNFYEQIVSKGDSLHELSVNFLGKIK